MNNNLKLLFVWKKRLKLRAECRKLYVENKKLYAEDKKLYVKCDILWARGDILWVRGSKLWVEAILNIYGNIIIEWKNWNKKHQSYECHLENGEVYGFDNLEVDDE